MTCTRASGTQKYARPHAGDPRDFTGCEWHRCDGDLNAGHWLEAISFDMTALTGGQPARLTAEQIAAGWEEGLRPIESVHHQAGITGCKSEEMKRGGNAELERGE